MVWRDCAPNAGLFHVDALPSLIMTSKEAPKNSLQELKDYVSRVLAIDAQQSDKDLLRVIQRRLKQYGVSEFLAAEDILHESFIRTQKAIVQQGTVIDNIPAWLNRVSLNVIREQGRRIKHNHRTYQKIKTNFEANSQYTEPETFIERYAQYIDQLPLVLNGLSATDQDILDLWLVKKCSWKVVSDHLTQTESKPVSEAAARKRGQRVLKKLKFEFSKGAVDSL